MTKGAIIQGALLIVLILGVIYLIAPFLLGIFLFFLIGFIGFYLWILVRYAGISRYFESRLECLYKVPEVYLGYKDVSVYGIRDPSGVKVFINYKGLTTIRRGSIPEVTKAIIEVVRIMELDQSRKSKKFWN